MSAEHPIPFTPSHRGPWRPLSWALALLLAPLGAVTYTWLPTGGSHDWTNALNWSPNGVPDGPTDVVNLTSDLVADQVIQLHSNITVGGLFIGDPTGGFFAYTIAAGTGGNLVLSNGGGAVILTKSASGNTVADTFSAPVVLGSDLVLSNLLAGNVVFSGVISDLGARRISVAGDAGSQATFSQNNTFTGGFTLQGGRLVCGASSVGPSGNPSSGALGAGPSPVVLAGGDMRSGTGGACTLANNIILAGDVKFNSVVGEKNLVLTGPVLLSNGNRVVQVDVGLNVASAAVILTGTLSDNGQGYGLVKAGVGNLNLAGSNTYSGTTTVSAGNLLVSNAYGVGTNRVTNNSVFTMTATNESVNFPMGWGSFSGTGTNEILHPPMGMGGGQLRLSQDYSGFAGTWFIGRGAPVAVGKVAIDGALNAGAPLHILTNAAARIVGINCAAPLYLYGGDTGESYGQFRTESGAVQSGPIYVMGPMTGAGDATIGCTIGQGTISGTIVESNGNWGLKKGGFLTNILSGTNRFTGPLVVLDGVLKPGAPPGPDDCGPFGSNATLLLSNRAGVALDLNGYNVSVGALSGGGAQGGWVELGNGVLQVGDDDSASSLYDGVIQGAGILVKVGSNTQNLTRTNTFSGGTWFSNGILCLGPQSCLGTGKLRSYPNAYRLQLTNGSVFTNDVLFIGGGTGNTYHGFIECPYGTAIVTNNSIWILASSSSGGHFGGTLDVSSAIGNSNGASVFHRTGTVTFRGNSTFQWLKVGNDCAKLGQDNAFPTNSHVGVAWPSAFGASSNSILDLAGFDQTLSTISNCLGSLNIPYVGNSSTTRDSTLTITGISPWSGLLVDRVLGGTRRLHLVVKGGTFTTSATNTWSGTTFIAGGTLRAGVAGVPGAGGAFGSNSEFILSNSAVSLLDLAGFDNEVGSLSGGGALGGNISLGSGNLTVGGGHSNTTYDGVMGGTGGLVKTGNGDLTLTGAQTYTGTTLITNGRLVLTGSLSAGGTVMVSNGGTLCGTGTAAGSVTVGTGGLFAPGLPGTNAAVFTAGNVSFLAGSRFVLDLDGSGPANDFLSCTGTVTCVGNLVATNIVNSSNGSFYEILRASNVTGHFSGIVDNGFLYQQGRLFQVRYSPTNVTLRDIGNSAPPPELEVTNPSPLAYWNGSAPVSGVSTNQDPTLANPSVYAMTNGGAWVFLGVTNVWSFAPGATNLNEGTNIFSFKAWLSNGLTNQIWHTNILDRTPPGMVSISGGANPFINQTMVTLAATDNFAVDRIFYTLDGGLPDTNALSVASGGTVTLTNGCILMATARDMAGNWGPTNVVVFSMTPNPVGGGSIGAITPNPFRPGNGNLTVSFQRQNLGRVDMSIYDIQGRMVADLKPVTDSALFRADFLWDGKTMAGQAAGRGMYLLIPRVGGVVRSDLGRRVYLIP